MKMSFVALNSFFSVYRLRFSKNKASLKHTQRTYCCSVREVTAGIIIIGDEILSGQTKEENSSFLLRNLNQDGIKVRKVSILPDEVNIIAEEMKKLSKHCTVVISSGGVGPTHDDVTYEAAANAFSDSLEVRKELDELYSSYFGVSSGENPAVQKLSLIPKSSILNFGLSHQDKYFKFPLVSIQNVYLLPGVPILVKKGFEIFRKNFLLKNRPMYMHNLYLSLDEVSLAAVLNETIKMYDQVKFGSYPYFNENYYKVRVTLQSHDKNEIDSAYNHFVTQIPKANIVEIKEHFLETAEDDIKSLSQTHPEIDISKSIIEKAFDTYELNQMCICFNGGKDCTALLHLIYACNKKLKDWSKMRILYVRTGEMFPEVETFIQSTVQHYDLQLTCLEGDLQQNLEHFLECHSHVKMVFMGTRLSDPGSRDLSHFCNTDLGWPPVMRVLPILDWSYKQVWNFIRGLQLPYCNLYDLGYTSMGVASKTRKNPMLAENKNGFIIYKPAYLLPDCNDERKGRS